jgi:HEAT repeat protein
MGLPTISTEGLVPLSLRLLRDKRPDARVVGANILGNVPNSSAKAVGALAHALNDESAVVRQTAATSLGSYRADAEAVTALVHALNDESAVVRQTAVTSLGSHRTDGEVVKGLVHALNDESADVRQTAVTSLGSHHADAQAAVPELSKIVVIDKDPRVRRAAAEALCSIGPGVGGPIAALDQALAQDPDDSVRIQVITSLRCLDPKGNEALQPIIRAVKDRGLRDDVRSMAIQALGAYGINAAKTLPLLAQELKSAESLGNRASSIRYAIGQALYRIALDALDKKSTETLDDLKAASALVERDPGLKNQYGYGLTVSVQYLEVLRHNSWTARLFGAVRARPWLAAALIVLAAYILGLGVFLLIFWRRPLWIYRIDQILDPLFFRRHFRAFDIELDVPIEFALWVGFFRHRDRVLDSWVQAHIDRILAAFKQIPTVEKRTLHLDLPMEINAEPHMSVNAGVLRDVIGKAPVRLLISGMGGVGKTSLACQIADWGAQGDESLRLRKDARMVPVMIEENCDAYASNEESSGLTTVVRDKLTNMLSGGAGPNVKIPEPFVRQMLERQRILVLVDGLSELNSLTRFMVQPGKSHFPANCLVVTSRNEDESLGLAKTVIKPALLKKEILSSFMGRYLTSRNARDLFSDEEFHSVCAHLVRLVGDHEVTPLLAKLYADHLIEQNIDAAQGGRPANVVDLVLRYVVEVNASIKEGQQDNTTVLRVAKIVAWECVRKYHFACAAPIEGVIQEIVTSLGVSWEGAVCLFRYLQDKLRLVQSVGTTGEMFKFSLDPVAEYLSALHVLEDYKSDISKWTEFLTAIQRAGSLDARNGFLIGLLDCCAARGESLGVPEFVAGSIKQTLACQPISFPAKVDVRMDQ